MLALTENAAEAIEGILDASAIPDGAGVRIAAASAEDVAQSEEGNLTVAVAETPIESDRVIDERGARVFVDEQVADYLDDKLLDARISEQQVSFVIGDQPR